MEFQTCCCAGLLHTNFLHLLGGLVPWLVVAFLLERRFGVLRIAPVWLACLLGAAFTSAALDAPCGLVRHRLSGPEYPTMHDAPGRPG
jgi:membrane associated rhomboid family serine protease